MTVVRIVGIVQARMGSTRLPGKVLMDLCGAPVLQRVLERTQRAGLDDVVLATTRKDEDDPLVAIAERLGLRWYRGSEHDVLERYVEAAREARADVVVRITADCPLIDPDVIVRVVKSLHRSVDFASNAIRRTYPRGLDTEVAWADTLERIYRMGTTPQAREHVFWFAYREAPALFATREVHDSEDNSELNWCVDTAADLERLRRLWDDVGYRDLIRRERGAA